MKSLGRLPGILFLLASLASAFAAASVNSDADPGQFLVEFRDGGLASVRPAYGATGTEFIANGRTLGAVVIQYRLEEGDWKSIDTSSLTPVPGDSDSSESSSRSAFQIQDGNSVAFRIENGFEVRDKDLLWTITLRNETDQPLHIGDLAMPLPMNRGGGQRGNNAQQGPRPPVILKHSFLSGHGSFLFWMRADSAPPFLTMVPTGKTQLEYWETGGGQRGEGRGYTVFIHSDRSGKAARERGTKWRQPNTRLVLEPRGRRGDTQTYSFKFLWADNYDDMRQVLVDEGGIDTHVAPGMTVPNDLFAQVALRSKERIRAVEAEFPNQTEIRSLGRRGEYRLYQVQFGKLGENRLKVRYGDNKHMFLEFFSTEPLETLIQKRGAFIAGHQVRDPVKWYNGLLCEWNMRTGVQLTPDNYDEIRGFRIYAVTCDDPGLSKPAYLAAKLAEFPVQSEVEALDHYIKHFVWGGLQHTTEEPYPYGIYGIPDWKTNRESADPGRNGQRHLWRVYDYPHIIQMYYGMYRVAKDHPQVKTLMNAREYLHRAYGTAHAMFTVPMEIERWSAYRTGFYNELVIVDLIDELRANGMREEADTLEGFWDRKVKSFVNRDQDLFRSEYAFDSTGFESTHALARWAMRRADPPGVTNTGIPIENASRFMEKQMTANLFCRGVIEPAYYYLGSDYRGGAGNAYTLTYMSQMGGWSVLDYGLNFASDPAPYLRLGYASYLSAWALMNTGTPDSNYGYWYPGKENDGGAGGGFEPAPFGRTWLGQSHTRGSWYYSCEIDLGYCGALRTAATLLTDDPIFGRFCFGGDLRERRNALEVIPKDGLRKRFHARLNRGNVSMILDRDHFATGTAITVRPDLREIQFQVESDNPSAHESMLTLSSLRPGAYRLERGNEQITTFTAEAGKELRLALPINPAPLTTSFRISNAEE